MANIGAFGIVQNALDALWFDIEPRMTPGASSNGLNSRRFRLGYFLDSERDYEIRFLKADGTTALVFVTSCVSDEHATETARRMMKDGFARFEISRGHTRVAEGP